MKKDYFPIIIVISNKSADIAYCGLVLNKNLLSFTFNIVVGPQLRKL